MASGELIGFLEKLNSELNRPGGASTWRKTVGDKKNHTFVFSKKRIKIALETVIKSSRNFAGKDKELEEALKVFQKDEFGPLLDKLEASLKQKFKSAIKTAATTEGVANAKFNANQFGFTAFINEDVSTRASKYTYIYNMYEKDLGTFYQEFLQLLGAFDLYRISESKRKTQRKDAKETGLVGPVSGMVDLTEQKAAFNLEHIEGANILHFINDSIVSALNAELQGTKVSSSDLSVIKNALSKEEYKLLMSVLKDAEKGTMKVSIGSTLGNLRLGGGKEKDLILELKKVIEKLNVVDLPGSDSLRQGARKKVVRATMKPMKDVAKKNPRVKVTAEDDVIKNGVGKAVKAKAYKSKKAAVKKRSIRKRAVASKRGPGQTQPSLFALIGILNEKLPQTVAGNMGSPRLNNRSGRFAQSVRVVDIARTSQGYPSIGYTYQTSPYQTFEVGRKQGSSDLDPRRLIDSSIRDIAQGMAFGRFYTRRL